jgi:hypothetical protein
MDIPQRVRAKVLWDGGHRTAKALETRGKIPQRTGRLYISEFNRGEDHNRRPYSKRNNPKQTPKIVAKVLKKARDRDKIYSLRDIGTSTGVCAETARKILKNNEFKYCRTKKRMLVNQETRVERLRFANNMLQRESDLGFLVFSDECSFWLRKSVPNKVWTQHEFEEEGPGTHGPKVHLWGAITSEGAVSLEIFEENLNAESYIRILKKKKKEIYQKMPHGFIYQHDGHPVHTAGITVAYINKNMPQTLEPPEWPPYSPDLNPIENVWGWLKNQVSKDLPKTVASLKTSIKKHWKSVTADFLAPFYDSLPNRLQMVIENEGGKIKY